MGLLTKALKTAVKAADAAKDASRTKPKSQMNPLVKPRNQEKLDVSKRKVDQSVKDALRKKALSEVVGNPQADQARMQLQLIENYEPKKTFGKEGLGEFYSPVINTLQEMSIGKQGTKGENISAFLNKRAPNIESSERKSFDLELDPQRMYTKEEVIDIAKGKGSEEYTISKVDDKNFRNEQRQKVIDKEEEYFVLTVDSTRPIDAAGTKVHFGNPKTNLGHTRSSIRRETPAGGPLTKKIKDRDRYILIEELQSDISADYTKQKKTSKKGTAPVNPAGKKITDIVIDNLGDGLEDLEFNSYESFSLVDEGIELAIERAYVKKFTENIDSVTAGKELAELLEKNYGVKTIGKKDINSVSQNAIKNNLVNENGVKYDGSDVDVDDTINNMFSEMEIDFETEMVAQKEFESQQKGLAINPPIETRSDYVKKLILANINYAKRNNINKIVVPDYKEIARQRINTFDYAMDQADADSPTKIKFQNLYKDLEDKKITQRVYNKKYNEMSKEYFENLFQKTYQDALKKVLNNLKTETKGAIKIGTRKLEYPAAGNFKGRTSTATEIDITDFDFDPETQALRFNMGGAVPPKNYAEGGVVSMNNQTQQAFALGGLKDEGGEIDEASGNRVPIGGTKKGVRDDIPASVSEGEFIFPEDVTRYIGLENLMNQRQEAKMGLRKMESMGQMGNSEEASMPDDLPFEMADLIVVGGQGEPMEFANGGFVPQMQTLQTAAVPTMGGGTSTGTQTPIVYDDFMKTPVVTMQEYRDANGNSIIITSVNGKATTAVPDGYTLYTPPANTASTTTQAAIQTVNRRSYSSTQDGGEGPEPQPDQPAPDYRNMNDDEFFSYMAEQNGFGAKAGNAAGLAIATMVGGPVGLLVSALMRNNKNNQMANMKSRIDRMDDGPAKTNALALYKEYGGETDPKKKEGLFANITNFVTGLVTPVANALGINQQDAAKVAQNAAVTEVSGAVIDTTPPKGFVDKGVPQGVFSDPVTPITAAPTVQVEGMSSPLSPIAAPATAATTAPSLNTMDVLGEPAGNIQTPTSTKDKSLTSKKPVPLTSPLRAGPPQAALSPIRSASETGPSSINPMIGTGDYPTRQETLRPKVRPERTGPDFDAPEFNKNLIGYDEVGVNKQPPSYAFIPKSEPVINPVSTQKATDRQDALTDAGLTANEVLARPDEPFLDAAARYARQGFDTFIAGDKNRGYFNPVNEQIDTAVAKAQDTIVSAAVPSQPKPYDFSDSPSGGYDEAGVQMQDPRDARVNQQFGNDNYIDPNVVPSNQQSLYTGASGEGYGIGQVDPRLAAAVQTQQALNIPSTVGDPYLTTRPVDANVKPLPANYKTTLSVGDPEFGKQLPSETAAQRRAKEVAAQRARIQTRNKEIATATSKIPAYIANSKQTQDSIKAGYVGSTTGGYAIGKISGSDGNDAGVVQRADGKVTKLRDLKGYEGLKGTQRGAMTVFSDAEGTKFVKSTFGKKTKLNGDKYEGPGITQQDKGGTPATATAKQVTKDGVRYNTSDGSGGTPSKPADPPGNTGGFTSIADMFDGGGPGESGAEEVKRGGGDGGSSRVICTELYKQGKLDRELYRMDVVYTAKHLSPVTVRGYHYWAVPMVVKMRSSTLLTNVFEYLTIARAKEIAHIVKPQEYKNRSVLGYIIKNVGEAICYSIGLFTDQKDWTVLYNKGAVK